MRKRLVCVLTLLLLETAISQENEEKPKYDKTKVMEVRGMAPFKVLDNPTFIGAKDAKFMKPEEYVLGISLDGESKAYPLKLIWWHHIANDTIGPNKHPITVVY